MRIRILLMTVSVCFLCGSAAAIPIDLNTFTADPAYDVVIAADGSSATIYEDPVLSSVWFYNDAIDIAGMMTLSFSYDFFEGAGNNDVLDAYLYDPSIGPGVAVEEIFVEYSGFGTVTWDLTGLGLSIVGLEFDLNAYDLVAGSYAYVSSVELIPIPEPASLLLLGSLILGVVGAHRGIKTAEVV